MSFRNRNPQATINTESAEKGVLSARKDASEYEERYGGNYGKIRMARKNCTGNAGRI